MPIFGQGVDASLGKVDYSLGNQAQMAAIKMRADSQKEIADSVAKTLKEYQQNKEIGATATADIEGMLQYDRTLAEGAPSNIASLLSKMGKDGGLNMKNAAVVSAYLKTAGTAKKVAEDRDVTNQTSSILNAYQENPDAIKGVNFQQLNPRVGAGVYAGIRALDQQKADLAYTKAQANALNAPKAVNTTAVDDLVKVFTKEALDANGGIPLTSKELSDIQVKAVETTTGNSIGAENQAALIPWYLKRGEEHASRAQAASEILPTVVKLQELLAKGVKTGWASEAKASFLNAARSVGFNVNEQQLADAQQLQALFGDFQMGIVKQSKGGSSDRDMTLFKTMTSNAANIEKANAQIASMVGKVAKKNLAVNRAFTETLSRTHSPEKANDAANKVSDAYDKEYTDALDELSKEYNVETKPSNIKSLTVPGQRQSVVNGLLSTLDRLIEEAASEKANSTKVP